MYVRSWYFEYLTQKWQKCSSLNRSKLQHWTIQRTRDLKYFISKGTLSYNVQRALEKWNYISCLSLEDVNVKEIEIYQEKANTERNQYQQIEVSCSIDLSRWQSDKIETLYLQKNKERHLFTSPQQVRKKLKFICSLHCFPSIYSPW